VSEDDFLQSFLSALPPAPREVVVPPGDDCAAIRLDAEHLLLVGVDQVIADRHYAGSGPAATPARLAGRKLLARNLSDVAAMGGVPLYVLTACGLSARRDTAWLREFLQGVVDLANTYGVHLIGGDVAVAPHDDVASLTVVGRVRADRVCLRSGAEAGDVLLSTGTFGCSLSTGHHLTFEPRCREGAWLVDTGCAKAMIDVSDGLLLDAWRMCSASELNLRLDPAAVPRRTPDTTWEQAAADGEDYELLCAVGPGNVAELLHSWPFADVPLTQLGDFVAGVDLPVVMDRDGRDLRAQGSDGYDHFRK